MKAFPRAKNLNVTKAFLEQRAQYSISKGYSKQKWIVFCEKMLDLGFRVSLYEAVQTFSKYITITDGDSRSFKVRFSNHRPIKIKEQQGDCDFFVGVTNLAVTTTDQAIVAVCKHFKEAPYKDNCEEKDI